MYVGIVCQLFFHVQKIFDAENKTSVPRKKVIIIVTITGAKYTRELMIQNRLFFTFKLNLLKSNAMHCAKSLRIQSYSVLHFPAFGLNTERYFASLRIQSKWEKMRTRMTPNTHTLYAVMLLNVTLTSGLGVLHLLWFFDSQWDRYEIFRKE